MASRKYKILSGISELRRRRPSLLQVQRCQWKHVDLNFAVEWIRGVNFTLYTICTLCIFASPSLYAFNDYNVLFRVRTCV